MVGMTIVCCTVKGSFGFVCDVVVVVDGGGGVVLVRAFCVCVTWSSMAEREYLLRLDGGGCDDFG